MKKRYLLLILVAVLLTGCKMNSKVPEEQSKYSIKLENNSSAGEHWDYFVSTEGIVEISQSYDAGGCPDDVDGCGGYNVYKLNALKEGSTVITFNHVDNNDYVIEDAIYEIIVDENLNIVTNQSGSYFNEE